MPPLGGARASQEKLAGLASGVRDLAARHGYPDRPTVRQRNAFDAECAGLLLDRMEIVTADAAHDGVWAFIGCVLLPDIGWWRFSDRSPARLLGGPRNAFGRLWWRARTLLDPNGEPAGVRLLDRLGEDELVQVMERPSLAGNPRVARQLCQCFLSAVDREGTINRMELMRDSAKRLIRLTPHISLDSLSADALEQIVAGCVAGAAEAVEDGPNPTAGVESPTV